MVMDQWESKKQMMQERNSYWDQSLTRPQGINTADKKVDGPKKAMSLG